LQLCFSYIAFIERSVFIDSIVDLVGGQRHRAELEYPFTTLHFRFWADKRLELLAEPGVITTPNIVSL
jgi:hypothetical protein